MNRLIPIFLVSGMAATLVGCQSATDPSTGSSSASTAGDTSEFTLVTLQVPNMV